MIQQENILPNNTLYMNKYILYYLLCSENPKDNLITIGDKKSRYFINSFKWKFKEWFISPNTHIEFNTRCGSQTNGKIECFYTNSCFIKLNFQNLYI